MKKLIFFTLLTLGVGTTVFASDEKPNGSKSISYSVLNQFAIEFADAKDIQWTLDNQFQKAKFSLDGEKVTAFYTVNGDYLGATKFVTAEKVPAKAKTELAKKYADYTLSYAIQVIARPAGSDSDDTGSYWIDIANESKELYIKVSSTGTLGAAKEVK